jgi:hypothetical protein
MAETPILIRPKPRDLGDGFTVRRALPAIEQRAIGPFVFLDEMGPVAFGSGHGLDVRPHPHIGLATVTYLFEGEIEHRDSLGTIQVIRPGDVNWMTAGSGIVHSERSPSPRMGGRLHGIQFWVGLPTAEEEAAPGFWHTPAAELPQWTQDGVTARLIVGSHGEHTSPVRSYSDTLYLDLQMEAGGSIVLDGEGRELGVYVVEGEVVANGQVVAAGELAAASGTGLRVCANENARAIAFGGAPLDGGRRHMWWNFVSSSQARIEQAKADWTAQTMGRVPGETEHIPLPER